MPIQEELARAKKKLEKAEKGFLNSELNIIKLFRLRFCQSEVERLEKEMQERMK